jgi:glycosyltransferase involved in cell wall biosynthesis
MKILVYTSLFPNNISPQLGIFVKERMSNFARKTDHQLQVVAPVPYYPPIKLGNRRKYLQVVPQEKIEGLTVYHPRYVMTPKIGMTTYGLTMFFSVLPTIRRIRRDFDFDLIDAHYIYPDGFAAVLLGRFFGKPVVVSARGSDIHLYSTFPLIRMLLRHTLQKANKVIAVCQAFKKTMVQLRVPENKISVIPNGVDLRKFHPASKNDSRARLGLSHQKIILSVGRLIADKGFDLLLRALRILLDEYQENNLCLVIVGEGDYRKELQRMIAALDLGDCVVLAGAVSHEELHLWYSAADLSCLASEREGSPNVVFESLACGTPVVAANVWGIPEILTSDDIGLLAERTEQDFARVIAMALKKSWCTETITQFARQQTWEQVVRSVATVFESALAEKKES